LLTLEEDFIFHRLRIVETWLQISIQFWSWSWERESKSKCPAPFSKLP